MRSMVSAISGAIIVGRLRQEHVLTHDGRALPVHIGGPATYAGCGAALWHDDVNIISRLWKTASASSHDPLFHQRINTRGIQFVAAYDVDPVFYHQRPDGTVIDHHPSKYYLSHDLNLPKGLIRYQSSNDGEDETRTFTPATIQPEDLEGQDFTGAAVHFTPGHFLTHATLPLQVKEQGGTLVTLAPSAAYMNPAFREDVATLVQGLTAFLPDENSCRSYFRRESYDLTGMAKAFGEMGAGIVVIQCEDQHKLLWDQRRQRMWSIPFYTTDTVNRIGTNDVFCGGFLAGLLKTGDPLEGALYGVIAESISSEGYGPWYAAHAHPRLVELRLDALRERVTRVAT